MAELNLGHVVGPGVPTGGTSGQILKKNSSTNFDTSWTNNDATTIPMSSSDATSINEAISPFVGTNVNWYNNVDLNNMKTSGYYPIGGTGLTNCPDGGWGMLSVIAIRQDTVEQTYYNVNNAFYTRELRSGSWSNWEQLALNSKTEIVYGTVSATGITFQTNDTYLIKIGHLVIMQLAFKPDANISAWTTFFTIPEGFKPAKTLYAPDLYNYNADRHYEIYRTSGEVQASFAMDANAQRRTSSIVWYV